MTHARPHLKRLGTDRGLRFGDVVRSFKTGLMVLPQAQTVSHRDSNTLFRPKVSLRSLNGRVSEQELGFFEIAADCGRVSRKCGTDRWRRSARSRFVARTAGPRPKPPIAQALTNLAALANESQQLAVFDRGCGHPIVDALPNPEWHGYGADPSSLFDQTCRRSAALAHLEDLQPRPGSAPASARRGQPADSGSSSPVSPSGSSGITRSSLASSRVMQLP